MKKGLAAVLVAAIMAARFVLPADARPKKQKRPDPQRRHEVQTQTPSRTAATGLTRTCWFETLQYDGLGVPTVIDARWKRIGGDNLATGVP
jgi:Ni/Co efflux regulator RcnB